MKIETCPARELAILIGVSIDPSMPNGEYNSPSMVAPSYRPGDDTEDAERRAARNNAASLLGSRRADTMPKRCTPGSAVEACALALKPLYRAPGESDFDGRTGSQAVIQALVESWPLLPSGSYDLAVTVAPARLIYRDGKPFRQQQDAQQVLAALEAGKTAEEIKVDMAAGKFVSGEEIDRDQMQADKMDRNQKLRTRLNLGFITYAEYNQASKA